MRYRKSSALILATGLALVLVPGSAYATAFAPAARHAQAPAPQAKVTVASGTATAANGSAVRDAIIDLYSWPSGKVLQALKPGQEVPRTLVATATANSAGKFSLSLAPGTLSANAVSSGFVNLEADSGSATWFFSTDAAKPAATAIRLTGAGAESPDYCTPWKEVKNLGAQPSIVGQAYIASNYKHVADSFTYSRGQSSSLGVGISPSGKKGTFTASGTVSTSSTANQSFPTEGPGNTLFLTFFKAGVYHDVCGTTGKVMPDGPVAGATNATWSAQPSGPPATRSSTRVALPGPTNVYQSCLADLSRRRTNGRSRGPPGSPSRRSALTARRRPGTTPRPSSASPSGQRGNCAEQTTIRRARRR